MLFKNNCSYITTDAVFLFLSKKKNILQKNMSSTRTVTSKSSTTQQKSTQTRDKKQQCSKEDKSNSNNKVFLFKTNFGNIFQYLKNIFSFLEKDIN